MLAEMNLNISDAPNLTAERINLSKEFRTSLVLDPIKENSNPAGQDMADRRRSLPEPASCYLLLGGCVVFSLIAR